MALVLIPETTQKVLSLEFLRAAAKQSERCHVVPIHLRRAIKRFLLEQENPNMRRKVLSLTDSFREIKRINVMLPDTTSKDLIEDPMKLIDRSKRWKIKSVYGDIGLKYKHDETAAYIASRMPAVYSACHRVLREVRRRLPGFAPKTLLDFGSGTGSVMWAAREVWPRSLERINLIEPSKSMQRASQSLVQGLKNLPLIQSYDNIQALMQNLGKSERKHDITVASYVLGEIPSLKDRITIVRQLWDLTNDVLVLVEPGTPQGSSIICQMRSYILWMEKRKCRKSDAAINKTSKDMVVAVKNGAYVVAPCSHDGRCPLENTGKYCHFVQRLQRTSSQRSYKRSKGSNALRGFEDEKFSFVVLRKGSRPREPWPLNGMKFDTLKEQHAKRKPEDLEIDWEDQFESEDDNIPYEEDPRAYDSDIIDTDAMNYDEEGKGEEEEEEKEEETPADLGGGWARIVFPPVKRGRQVSLDICRSAKPDASEGIFERQVVTLSKNPFLHKLAHKSQWGDLWPCEK